MHETALMQNILAAAAQALAPYRVKRVNTLEVRAGVLANVLPDAFFFAFEALAQGTVFAGACLQVEKTPLGARCLDCGATYESFTLPPVCPQCGSRRPEILNGTEVLLASIDFDEEDEDED